MWPCGSFMLAHQLAKQKRWRKSHRSQKKKSDSKLQGKHQVLHDAHWAMEKNCYFLRTFWIASQGLDVIQNCGHMRAVCRSIVYSRSAR